MNTKIYMLKRQNEKSYTLEYIGTLISAQCYIFINKVLILYIREGATAFFS